MRVAPELRAAPQNNRYAIHARIRRGATGLVYKAADLAKNLTVALKSLKFLEPEEIYHLKTETLLMLVGTDGNC